MWGEIKNLTVRLRRRQVRLICWDLVNSAQQKLLGEANYQPPHVCRISKLDHLLSRVFLIQYSPAGSSTKTSIRMKKTGSRGWFTPCARAGSQTDGSSWQSFSGSRAAGIPSGVLGRRSGRSCRDRQAGPASAPSTRGRFRDTGTPAELREVEYKR